MGDLGLVLLAEPLVPLADAVEDLVGAPVRGVLELLLVVRLGLAPLAALATLGSSSVPRIVPLLLEGPVQLGLDLPHLGLDLRVLVRVWLLQCARYAWGVWS